MVSQDLIETVRDAIKDQRYPIFIHGTPGVGKSSLAGCIFRSVPGTPRWFTATNFIRMVQTCRREGKIALGGGAGLVNEKRFWEIRVDRPELLVIDDIGLRKATNSQFEIIFELVDRRVGLPTVFTSNCDLDGISATFDERISSRFSAGTVIEMNGPDRRIIQGKLFRFEGD